MKKELNKEFVVREIDKFIYALEREHEVSTVIFNTTGIECGDPRNDHPQIVLKHAYESLIWNLILIIRECPELTSEEFEYFSDLMFDIAWGNCSNWDAEKIYDYFINVEQIIKDFNIGVVEKEGL